VGVSKGVTNASHGVTAAKSQLDLSDRIFGRSKAVGRNLVAYVDIFLDAFFSDSAAHMYALRCFRFYSFILRFFVLDFIV
jgi:hypothetical protein